MTTRQRAHRAFFNASAAGSSEGPGCWRREKMFGGHSDAPACGVVCDCVTDAIEVAQADTGRDSVEALREILARKENDRKGRG